jgi:hypothetical protein
LALQIVYLYSFTPISFWLATAVGGTTIASFGIALGIVGTGRTTTDGVFVLFGVLVMFLIAVGFIGHMLEYQVRFFSCVVYGGRGGDPLPHPPLLLLLLCPPVTPPVVSPQLRRSFLDEYLLRMNADLLQGEKDLANELLNSMLPADVIAELKAGRPSPADTFEHVTVLFCEITNFAEWCRGKSPQHVVKVLNIIYSAFDDLVDAFPPGSVHKVETVNEIYMLVSGCPARTYRHAEHAANMALAMVASVPGIRRTGELKVY